MSLQPPIVCQTAWVSVLPQVAIMGLIMWLLSMAGRRHFVVLGAGEMAKASIRMIEAAEKAVESNSAGDVEDKTPREN